MRSFVVAVCIGAALLASEPILAKTTDAPLKLTASGEGRVQCVVANARGNVLHTDLKPKKGEQKEYSNAGLDHGSCEYRAPSKGQLTVTVEGGAWVCPLNSASGTSCAQTFASGVSGVFRLVQREGS